MYLKGNSTTKNCRVPISVYIQHLSNYLDPGERFNDPDEVLLQQVIIQFGQMGADDGVIPQL